MFYFYAELSKKPKFYFLQKIQHTLKYQLNYLQKYYFKDAALGKEPCRPIMN